MTKSQLSEKMAEIGGLTKKDAENALSSLLQAVQESLAAGENVVLVGFGTFEVHDRKAREGHNPRTGEKVQIPACKVPVFRAGKLLKEAVNKPKKKKASKKAAKEA